jgi:PilZ domain
MGDRRETRIKAVLPLRLWGTDAAGKPYMAVAYTLDVSRTGARLGGVTVELKVGDTVGLQYKNAKARYRVQWVGDLVRKERQIGVVSLQPEKDLWGVQLPQPEPDAYDAPRSRPKRVYEKRNDDRRRNQRYPVTGTAVITAIGGAQGRAGHLADLSAGGCYIETDSPADVGTRLTVLMRLQHVEIVAFSVVRVSFPRVGMGLQFTDLNPSDAERLKILLGQLHRKMHPE